MCDICGNVPDWMTGRPAADVEKPAPVKTAVSVLPTKEEAERGVERIVAANELLDYFKEWRSQTSQRTGVPAYVVLSDAALEDLCRKRPSNLRELLRVSGFGERKAELYGADIFARFDAFERGARAAVRERRTVSPAEETLRLLAEGKTFLEIAQIRGRKLETVVNMAGDLIEKGRLEYRIEWVGQENHRRISEAIDRLGSEKLKPLKDALPREITYDQIRLVVAHTRHLKEGDRTSVPEEA